MINNSYVPTVSLIELQKEIELQYQTDINEVIAYYYEEGNLPVLFDYCPSRQDEYVEQANRGDSVSEKMVLIISLLLDIFPSNSQQFIVLTK